MTFFFIFFDSGDIVILHGVPSSHCTTSSFGLRRCSFLKGCRSVLNLILEKSTQGAMWRYLLHGSINDLHAFRAWLCPIRTSFLDRSSYEKQLAGKAQINIFDSNGHFRFVDLDVHLPNTASMHAPSTKAGTLQIKILFNFAIFFS